MKQLAQRMKHPTMPLKQMLNSSRLMQDIHTYSLNARETRSLRWEEPELCEGFVESINISEG